MPLQTDTLSVWDISFRWAGYDPDRIYLLYPLEVKDYFRLLLEAILKGEIYCGHLVLAKRPQNSKADPNYYIRTHLNDVHACIWGHYYKKKLLKWAQIDRADFYEWCERRGIPLPGFWFPEGWKYDFEWPEFGTRATWAKHEEPAFGGGCHIRFDVPDFEYLNSPEYQALKAELLGEDYLDDSKVDVVPDKANELTKVMVQKLALNIWKEHPEDEINISQMANHDVIQKYAGVGHFQVDTVRGWIREVAPDDKRGRRGRPPKNGTKD